jgi:hypothetical protein
LDHQGGGGRKVTDTVDEGIQRIIFRLQQIITTLHLKNQLIQAN